MRHVPSGFVGNIKFSLKLFRGDTLFGRANHVDSEKPFGQRQMGVMEDGADGD